MAVPKVILPIAVQPELLLTDAVPELPETLRVRVIVSPTSTVGPVMVLPPPEIKDTVRLRVAKVVLFSNSYKTIPII